MLVALGALPARPSVCPVCSRNSKTCTKQNWGKRLSGQL